MKIIFTLLISFFSGTLFSIGLYISRMVETKRIFAFLDVFGKWDPTLLFAMLGAVSVYALVYFAIKKRKSPLLEDSWHLPQKTQITKSLIAGSFIFGAGWALGGYCPGPAITSLASFEDRPLIFVGSMLAGMFIFKICNEKFNFNR
ncbi:MAG: DUF6691 family protein [Pseudobdellovibrio sp.]